MHYSKLNNQLVIKQVPVFKSASYSYSAPAPPSPIPAATKIDQAAAQIISKINKMIKYSEIKTNPAMVAAQGKQKDHEPLEKEKKDLKRKSSNNQNNNATKTIDKNSQNQQQPDTLSFSNEKKKKRFSFNNPASAKAPSAAIQNKSTEALANPATLASSASMTKNAEKKVHSFCVLIQIYTL